MNNKIIIKNTRLLNNSTEDLILKDLDFKAKLNKTVKKSLIIKKIKSPIKSISFMKNDTGIVRHFTPAAQEWFNSIYSFNKNYIKTLPSADKNLMKLLKGYFNFFVHPNLLPYGFKKALKIKRIANRYIKLSSKKVFIGKGELKHTNQKIIITKYIYNAEEIYLRSIYRNILNMSLSVIQKKPLKKWYFWDRNKKDWSFKYNRPFTLEEFLNTDNDYNLYDHSKILEKISFKIFWKKYIQLIGIKRLREEEKINNIKEKWLERKFKSKKKAKSFVDRIKKKVCFNDLVWEDKDILNYIDSFSSSNYSEFKLRDQIEIFFHINFKTIQDDFTCESFIINLMKFIEEKDKTKLYKFKEDLFKIVEYRRDLNSYMEKATHFYYKKLLYIKFLLQVNNLKFKTPTAIELLGFIKTIYNKKVELNIVNLTKFHLNTDIYTQAVALKLKNRDNKLFRVLTSSLNKVKLPNVSRATEKIHISNRDEYLSNKIRNLYINSMFKNSNEDSLNSLLLSFFSSVAKLNRNFKKRFQNIKQPTPLLKYVINSLKHIKLAGIRVEAKGRLTRRFTASRSVFKLKWKGGLKNVDSSFKGLSAIMLRGDRKSNVQYSIISSKNRNGAYGVKGWMSNK